MERYFKRKSPPSDGPSIVREDSSGQNASENAECPAKLIRLDLSALPGDPGERKRISDYHLNEQEDVRREYVRRGPFQPREHDFAKKEIGGYARRFNPAWFDKYRDWLEYSIKQDAAFCLCCYLFRPDAGNHNQEAFVSRGFSSWSKTNRLDLHVGKHSSAHNKALQQYKAFLKNEQATQAKIDSKKVYEARLLRLVGCVKLILRQGFPLCGLAFEEMRREGDLVSLVELMDMYRESNSTGNCPQKSTKILSGDARENEIKVNADLQRDLMCAAAKETTKAIIKDLGGDLFGMIIDQFQDVSYNTLLAVALRFVDDGGLVKERLIGITKVTDSSASLLKPVVASLLSEHGLNIARMRGLSYNAACDISSMLCDLKDVFQREVKAAYHTHCFSHQLHSALATASQWQFEVYNFFKAIFGLFDVVGAPCKKEDMLEHQQGNTADQEWQYILSLQGVGDIRWEFCYEALLKCLHMFPSIIRVLEFVETEGIKTADRRKASIVLDSLCSFDFVISMHLMCSTLGITNELSIALQMKDIDIVNAVNLVDVCKKQMHTLKNGGWGSLLDEVYSSCKNLEIPVPDMEGKIPKEKSRFNGEITNLHHYHNNVFNGVIESQLQVLDSCFNAMTSELLLCIACLSPRSSFQAFDKTKLLKLAKFYPNEFFDSEYLALNEQLDKFISDIPSDERFCNLKGLDDLCRVLVETEKQKVYPSLYLLLKLALILPVATPSIERSVSAMKTIQNKLKNQVCDQFMSDAIMTYIESDILDSISNEAVMHCYQNLKNNGHQDKLGVV